MIKEIAINKIAISLNTTSKTERLKIIMKSIVTEESIEA